MAVSATIRKRLAWVTGLRGLLTLLFGIFCIVAPGVALTALVVMGAVVLFIAGAIGLWSLTFGGVRSPNYWWDVVRAGLALLLGALILVSPLLSTLLTVTFLSILIGLEFIILGAMELWLVWRERASYASIWPAMLQGGLFVLFGLVLVIFPMASAVVGVVWVGIVAVLIAIGLLAMAWRLYRAA